MKIQIDLKSAVLGLVLGTIAMFTMGDTLVGQNGRYQATSTANFVTIVDTQTGQAWGHLGNTDGENERDSKFWDTKGQ